MIIIDRNKHPNLFGVFAKELHWCGYTDNDVPWTKIEIGKTTSDKLPWPLDDNVRPGRFNKDGSISDCTIYQPWLESILDQNETLFIEFTKARLGH